MVVKKTIHALKTRPHDERRAFAGLSAIVVMVVLTGAWGLFFLEDIGQSAADEQSYTSASAPDQAAAAATAKASVDSIVQSTIPGDIGAQTPGDTGASIPDTRAQYNPPQLLPPSSMTNTTDNEVVKTLQAALRQ